MQHTSPYHTMSFGDLLRELFSQHSWKAAGALILMWMGGHLIPIAGFIAAGVALTMADWATGVAAAMRRGQPITSRGLRRTVAKAAYYGLAIVCTLIVESTFFAGSTYMVYFVSAYIALVELYSNLENISVVTGRDILGAFKRAIKQKVKHLTPDDDQPKDQGPTA